MDTIKVMNDYIDSRYNNNANGASYDDGINGKAFELAIRSYITNRTAKKVKAQGKTDIRPTVNGKRFTFEIKTACGEIETASKNQYVIYCADVDIDFPAEQQGYVFTREQWLTFVNGYTGRGSFTRTDSRGHVHIQSFYVSENKRPKASKPIARYIESVLFVMPTVEEFFNR